MENFNDILNQNFIDILNKKNIFKPTNVQEVVIPLITNDNKDYIVTSKTGSGKTLAYLLPLLKTIDEDIKTPQILIITPTHELSSQIYHEILFFDKYMDNIYNPALIIGGSNIKKQLEKLKTKPKIIIGSCGRILELNKMKKLKMHTIKTIVLDEGDRLLDYQNLNDTKAVIKTTLKDRRILYFSASIDDDSEKILNEIMKSPEKISTNSKNLIPDTIKHYYIECELREKTDLVRKIIRGLEVKKTIVFVNNPNMIEIMVKKFNYHKLKTVGLHGSNKKHTRFIAIKQFKEQQTEILVASDLASRGLDIPNVDLVINIDIPENPVFYQHRCGRTGRSNKDGMCISITTKGEVTLIKKIATKFKIDIQRKKLSFGNLTDIESE